MKLEEIVCFDAIIPQLKASDRDGIIAELILALDSAGEIGSAGTSDIIQAVVERENEASTGVGKGVAVPHVKHPAITGVVAALGCCAEGVDFSSLDKQPVFSVILLLSPVADADKHLQAMESIFRNLQKDDFRKFLRQAQTVEQIKETIRDIEEESSV